MTVLPEHVMEWMFEWKCEHKCDVTFDRLLSTFGKDKEARNSLERFLAGKVNALLARASSVPTGEGTGTLPIVPTPDLPTG